MSDLVNELGQHALMCANEIKRLNPDKSDEVGEAYDRVKVFAGNICPACWVKDAQMFVLEIEAVANKAKCYRCRHCGFSGVFAENGQ